MVGVSTTALFFREAAAVGEEQWWVGHALLSVILVPGGGRGMIFKLPNCYFCAREEPEEADRHAESVLSSEMVIVWRC
jgi:hypothetical protein